jgi:predicted metal-dependent peptidase
MSAEEIYDDLIENEDGGPDGSLIDEHIDWGEGGKDGQPQYTKEEMAAIRDQVVEAVIQASQASGAGNTPAEIARMIKSLTEPKMNWRELLRNQIQSILRNDFTWQRPNRKTMQYGIYLPGTSNDETIDVALALDMSGSISDEQAMDFLSEVKGIMDEYRDYKIKLWTFDTKVYNEQDYTMENGDELMEYNIIGGGGTSFECNWEYMKEHDIVPKKFIMFTDMYPCGGWGDEDYCDTIFLGHGTTSIVAPFGQTVYYDDAK